MPSFDTLESSVVYDSGISNRINARSISWNASGTTLAMAGSDRTTRLYSMADLMSNSSSSSSSNATSATNNNSNNSAVRELSSIAGSVDRVRFHPSQDSLLASTSASDAAVRLWDLRSSSSAKAAGTISLTGGTTNNNRSTVDVSWSPSSTAHLVAVTEKNGTVHVVDTRQLGGTHTHKTPAPGQKPVGAAFRRTVALSPKIVDACVFSPSGDHLVAATSNEGYGELTVWNWETYPEPGTGPPKDTDDASSFPPNYVYPAHTGPIYSFCFSPNGQRLATGGGDALVGLWDVDTMVCSSTMTRCDRFVRSVSFSFDSQIVATSTEEALVDLADASSGNLVGKLSMTTSISNASNSNTTNSNINSRLHRMDRNAPGADEIAFHPKAHVLACARCDSGAHSPLTIVKLTLGRQ